MKYLFLLFVLLAVFHRFTDSRHIWPSARRFNNPPSTTTRNPLGAGGRPVVYVNNGNPRIWSTTRDPNNNRFTADHNNNYIEVNQQEGRFGK